MAKQILFLNPTFQERIWGGTKLKEKFGYDIPHKKFGECWAISAHPNGLSIVKSGVFKGKSLKELWEQNKELFGNLEGEKFPLLVKILDADNDLSVQVHPKDEYAKLNENGELGKTECWYILDCKENAELILGHNANSKEEFIQMVNQGSWGKLLKRVRIKPGDFFYVPAGMMHAICKGTLVLETQQSSDTTYRIYDYDRLDNDGNKRELHIEKSIDVTTIPHIIETPTIVEEIFENSKIVTYVKCEYFSVYRWNIFGKQEFDNGKPFLLVSVIEGEGMLDDNHIRKCDHFIICNGYNKFTIDGKVELMVSHI